MKKSNVFIQRDSNCCGACSIQSIVSFYGGYVPLETVLEDTLTNKCGTNAYEMIRALKKYGFNAYGIKIKLDDLDKKYLPIIAHTIINGIEHFLVIYEYDNTKVVTMDPNYGKKVYSRWYFDQIFDEVVLIAIPNGKIEKYKHKNTLQKVLFKEFIKNKRKVLYLLILNIVFISLSLITNFYIKISTETAHLLLITILFMLLSIIKWYIWLKREIIDEKLYLRFGKSINHMIIDHIFKLPTRYLNNKRVGEIVHKINDITYIKDWFLKLALIAPIDSLIFISGLMILFNISTHLSIVSLIGFIIYFVIVILTTPTLYKKEKEAIDANNSYSGDLTEYLSNIESIKNLNKEEYFLDNIDKTYTNYLTNYYELSKYSTAYQSIKELSHELIYILTLMLGVISIHNNTFSLMDLMIFTSIHSLISSSFINIMNLMPSYMHIKVIFRESSEFLDVKEETKGHIEINQIDNIKIDNLSYSYDYYHDIIKSLILEINSGDKILFSGPSGIGKSTLAKCLSGYLNDYRGTILLNGINYQDISLKSLRNEIIYVGQEEKLFKGSIKDNILLNSEINDHYEKVIRLCNVDEIIKNRVEHDNSIILEDGSNLSGGERSRIILARSLYRKPKLLIIDETLSNISEHKENQILSKLLKEESLTLIYITHRNKEEYFKKVLHFRKDGSYEIRRM